MAELTKHCRKCGRQLSINAKFCKFCGADLSEPAAPQPQFHQEPAQQASYQQPQYQQPAAQQGSFRQAPSQQASYQQAPAQQASYRQPPYQQAPAQQPSFQQAAAQQAVRKVPEIIMSAAAEPGEFDYGDLDIQGIIGGIAGAAGSFVTEKAPGMKNLSQIRGLAGNVAGNVGGSLAGNAGGSLTGSLGGSLAGNVGGALARGAGGASKGKPKIIFLLILLAVLWIADVLLTSFGVMPEVGSYFITGLTGGALIRVAFGVISSAVRKKPA